MAKQNTLGAGERQSLNLSQINPLIEQEGGTAAHVQCILGLLSSLILNATDGEITLSYDDAHGLAMILETCKAALANGSEVRHD